MKKDANKEATRNTFIQKSGHIPWAVIMQPQDAWTTWWSSESSGWKPSMQPTMIIKASETKSQKSNW